MSCLLLSSGLHVRFRVPGPAAVRVSGSPLMPLPKRKTPAEPSSPKKLQKAENGRGEDSEGDEEDDEDSEVLP